LRRFVLDASVALAWCFAAERTPQVVAIESRMLTESVVVPALWSLEVSNVLVMSERRQRITPAERVRLVQTLNSYPVQVDLECVDLAHLTLADLARQHHLTVYDAAYLEVATRLSLPLATLDEPRCSAARAQRVTLLIE